MNSSELTKILGEKLGFVSAYLIFTTIIYIILNFLGKNLSYLQIIIITFSITLVGRILKRILK